MSSVEAHYSGGGFDPMKLVIGGYYGAGNLGDELLLGLLIHWLKEASHDIVVVTLDEAHTRALHGVTAIDRRKLADIIHSFREADAFILGGGGLFQDHHRFTISDLHTYPAPGVSYYAQLCFLARQIGVPYMLVAMGVGPLRTEEAQRVTREVFQHAAFASVRDQASADLLKQIGMDVDIVVGADPAWLAPKPSRVDLGQRYPVLAGRRVLAVTPRQWPFSDGWRHSLLSGLAEAESAGWAILWLPFQSSDLGDDVQIVQELDAQLNPQTPHLTVKCNDPAEVAQIIASADALIAMRLHALILGLSNRVPTLAIEYDEKLASTSLAARLPNEMRLRLTDPASRFCNGVRALIGTNASPLDEMYAALDGFAGDAMRIRETMSLALGKLPPRVDGLGWRAPERDWIIAWFGEQLAQQEGKIGDLLANNASLTTQLDSIHHSLGWRVLAPFRASARAKEILRDQGWKTLLRKLYRALTYHAVQPLLKRLTQEKAKRQLQEVLKRNPGRAPIFFPSTVPWNLHLFQRPHHLAKELAARGYLYFFCVPVSSQDHVLTFDEVAPGCYITPHEGLVDAVPKKIVHLYSTDNMQTIDWVRTHLARGDRILYEYVDEIHEDISGHRIPPHVWDKHQYLLRNEEVVCVATADKLYQEVRAVRSFNCGLVTNGVDIAHFAVKRDQHQIPSKLRDVIARGKPVIGYFGALAKWFDYELVAELAVTRPGYEIVLIGPDYDGSLRQHTLDKLPNVTMLGTVEYKLLPRYACWFDVATIPFRINGITESTSPIKLFEYMALGCPIVTTDMPECRKYRSVLIGVSGDHFIAQIDHALELGSDASYLSLLRKEAEENSWVSKAAEIESILEEGYVEQSLSANAPSSPLAANKRESCLRQY